MKYQRFYDNLKITTNNASLSDIILIIFAVCAALFITIPVIGIFLIFLSLVMLYIVGCSLIKTVISRLYK